MAELTREYLLSHGWSERPADSYSEEEVEEGYVDNRLFIPSFHYGVWCYTSVATNYNNSEWRIALGVNGRVRDLTVHIYTIEEYERVMDFYNGFN